MGYEESAGFFGIIFIERESYIAVTRINKRLHQSLDAMIQNGDACWSWGFDVSSNTLLKQY